LPTDELGNNCATLNCYSKKSFKNLETVNFEREYFSLLK